MLTLIPPAPPPVFLRPEEAAHELRCSRTHIYRLLADGTLPSRQIGKLRRIPRAAIEAMAAAVIEAAR